MNDMRRSELSRKVCGWLVRGDGEECVWIVWRDGVKACRFERVGIAWKRTSLPWGLTP